MIGGARTGIFVEQYAIGAQTLRTVTRRGVGILDGVDTVTVQRDLTTIIESHLCRLSIDPLDGAALPISESLIFVRPGKTQPVAGREGSTFNVPHRKGLATGARGTEFDRSMR